MTKWAIDQEGDLVRGSYSTQGPSGSQHSLLSAGGYNESDELNLYKSFPSQKIDPEVGLSRPPNK